MIRVFEERARKEAEGKAKAIIREREQKANKEVEDKVKAITRNIVDKAKREAEQRFKQIVREAEGKAKVEATQRAKTVAKEIEEKAKVEAAERARVTVEEREQRSKREAEERGNAIVRDIDIKAKREAEERAKKEEPLKKTVNLDDEEPFHIGITIAKLLTSSWNSQENPSKVHIFNRRIHHGEIGTLLGLSNLCTKYPIPAGILAGIGSGLVKDDHDDMKEWFTFKKKK